MALCMLWPTKYDKCHQISIEVLSTHFNAAGENAVVLPSLFNATGEIAMALSFQFNAADVMAEEGRGIECLGWDFQQIELEKTSVEDNTKSRYAEVIKRFPRCTVRK